MYQFKQRPEEKIIYKDNRNYLQGIDERMEVRRIK
jgi:hypothetical protein